MSRCWAYSRDKVRCALDAGHDEPHTVYITWRDDECYEPHTTIHTLYTVTEGEPEPPMTGTSPAPTLPDPMPTPTGCVACGHKHAGGECKCGCYDFIG